MNVASGCHRRRHGCILEDLSTLGRVTFTQLFSLGSVRPDRRSGLRRSCCRCRIWGANYAFL
jgi:hypothetical protein